MKCYFEYTGKIHICDMNANRIQPYIVDMNTGKLHKPVITKKNKAFAKFWNAREKFMSKDTPGFYFTCDRSEKSGLIKNVMIYTKEEFIDQFAEYII